MRLSSFSSAARLVLLEARASTLGAGREAIGSAALLIACAGDEGIAAGLEPYGVTRERLAQRLGLLPRRPQSRGDQPAATSELSAAELLAALGIDLDEVRRRLPTVPVDDASYVLRRLLGRPFRVTLGAGGAREVPFDAGGRKVLEVALWHGRRRHRSATPADLLRGILCDGRDPVCAVLAREVGADFNPMLAALFGADQRAA